MIRITIGDKLIEVPNDYIDRETYYCSKELEQWAHVRDLPEDSKMKQYVRKKVLKKRVEFYDRIKHTINSVRIK